QPQTMRSASSGPPRQKTSTENSEPEVIRRPPSPATNLAGTAGAAAIPPEFAEGRGGLPSLPNLNKERIITVKEAAYRLRKSADAVYLWLRTGRLRGWQPGGRGCQIMVLESSVDEALLCSF